MPNRESTSVKNGDGVSHGNCNWCRKYVDTTEEAALCTIIACPMIICAQCWPNWKTDDAFCRTHAPSGFRTWPHPGESTRTSATSRREVRRPRVPARSRGQQHELPTFVTTTRGPVALRPVATTARLMGVTANDLMGPRINAIRTARRLLECQVPPDTARLYRRARHLLNHFVKTMKYGRTCEEVISPDVIADFLMWRVAPPVTEDKRAVPQKPPGFANVVDAATASGDISAIRALWAILGREDLVRRTEGPQVDRTLARLSANIRGETVRKTPVRMADVQRLVEQAMRPGAEAEVVRDAAVVAIGFLFMMRNGELTAAATDVIIRGTSIGVTFRGEKARGGKHRLVQPKPRVRWVESKMLADVLERYLQITNIQEGPLFPADATTPSSSTAMATRPISTNAVRKILRRRLGDPPTDEQAERMKTGGLPWSLRAGGATYLMQQGATVEEVRRLGRWTSDTSLQYSVMGRHAQLEVWKRAANPKSTG